MYTSLQENEIFVHSEDDDDDWRGQNEAPNLPNEPLWP